MRHLVAYDISNGSVRARVARRLDKEGLRYQRSVFLVNQSVERVRSLLGELEEWLDPRTDSILAWQVAKGVAGEALEVGHPMVLEPAAVVISPETQVLIAARQDSEAKS